MSTGNDKPAPGFTNYNKWDRLATDLVSRTEQEEEEEKKNASEELGHTRVPYSAAEAEERAKAEMARKAKAALDAQKERESSAVCFFDDVLKPRDDGGGEATFVVDEDTLGSRRVISLRHCKGPGRIVLPSSLSRLTHAGEEMEKVEGVIKVFIEDCHDCRVVVECKILTRSLEIVKCSNLDVLVAKERLSTVQADLCQGLRLTYADKRCFGRMEDKIYHAGVSDMKVTIMKGSGSENILMQKTMDYLKDGAVVKGTATAEEFQFVTSVVDGQLITERLIRLGNKATTQREIDSERLKHGDSTVSETSNGSTDSGGNCSGDSELHVMSLEELIDINRQCFTHKADGNEAFKSGEYAQAVLFYSLAIDKSDKLEKPEDWDTSSPKQPWFNERHICFSNRSACFLKLGHHEKALADADSCLAMEPSYLKALFRKGLALHAMKEYEEAMPFLAQCAKIEPKNKQIKQALQFCEVFYQREMRKRMGQ